MKLVGDCHNLIFLTIWRIGWNDMKLGTYIKWGMLSPNMVKKLVSDCHLINYSWNLSNLWRSGWNDMKLGTYIKWGMLSPNMVKKLVIIIHEKLLRFDNMVKKLVSDCHLINYSWNLSNLWRMVEMTWNLVRISSEVCPNMVKKLVSDCHLINYSWNLSNIWRSGWNDMKLGTYIKWGMLSPNMVKKLVSDSHLINYSWNLSNLWRSGLTWMVRISSDALVQIWSRN